jgi:molybdopterin/thiamine biosynthesis adenylyltransferase
MSSQTSEWMSRYSRQILLPQIGGIGQKKLDESTVALVGTGSIARPLFLYGVGAGIGRWGISGRDENQARELADLGKERNPEVKIQIASLEKQLSANLELWVAEWSLVVDTSSEPTIQKRLAEVCQRRQIPLISAWSRGDTGWLLQSPCPVCLPDPGIPDLAAGDSALSKMLPGLLGTFLAQQAIKTLITPPAKIQPPQLTGFQARTSTFFQQKTDKNPTCPYCNLGQ